MRSREVTWPYMPAVSRVALLIPLIPAVLSGKFLFPLSTVGTLVDSQICSFLYLVMMSVFRVFAHSLAWFP